MRKEGILIDHSHSVGLDELLGELLRAFSAKHQARDECNSDGNGFDVEVFQGVQSQVNNVCFSEPSTDVVDFFIVGRLVERDVEDLEDCNHHVLGRLEAATTF